MISLRRRALVRIQVAMVNPKVLGKPSNARPCAVSDVVVKFKSYVFRFRREPADFVPEQDFVPLIWVKQDDSDDGGDGSGEGGDDAMDTSEPTATAPSASTPLAAGAPAAQSGMNVTTSTGGANKVATHIVVTHFNLNPQTPHAITIVAKLRVTSPSL
jgi:hypothetical protein